MAWKWAREVWMGRTPPAVNSPASPLQLPTRRYPQWYVAELPYQGGVPILKRSSMTGGGFVPMRSLAGKEAPSWQPYATPVSSMLGGGQLPSRPPFTTALGGNAAATGSGV